MLKIGKDTWVTLRQRVTVLESARQDATSGTVIDNGDQPIAYVHGGYDDIFVKIEQALEGKSQGDVVTIALTPEDSFGAYDPALCTVAAAAEFETPPKVDQQIEIDNDPDGRLFRVVAVDDDKAVLDGNHPLAGLHLQFQAEVLGVRAATEAEIGKASNLFIVRVNRLQAVKMALINLVAAPVMALVVAGLTVEWLGDGWLSGIVALLMLVTVLACLWSGLGYVRDVWRGGEALRMDVTGLRYRGFDQLVSWDDIAKVETSDFKDNVWFTVTLNDGRSFQMDVSALRSGAEEISQVLARHLPAAKRQGL